MAESLVPKIDIHLLQPKPTIHNYKIHTFYKTRPFLQRRYHLTYLYTVLLFVQVKSVLPLCHDNLEIHKSSPNPFALLLRYILKAISSLDPLSSTKNQSDLSKAEYFVILFIFPAFSQLFP